MSTCCRILRMVFSFHITKLCSWHTEMCTIHTVKCIFNRIVTCYDNPSLNVNLPFFFVLKVYILCVWYMFNCSLLVFAAFLPLLVNNAKCVNFFPLSQPSLFFYYCKWFYSAKHVKCIVRAIVRTFKYSSTIQLNRSSTP